MCKPTDHLHIYRGGRGISINLKGTSLPAAAGGGDTLEGPSVATSKILLSALSALPQTKIDSSCQSKPRAVAEKSKDQKDCPSSSSDGSFQEEQPQEPDDGDIATHTIPSETKTHLFARSVDNARRRPLPPLPFLASEYTGETNLKKNYYCSRRSRGSSPYCCCCCTSSCSSSTLPKQETTVTPDNSNNNSIAATNSATTAKRPRHCQSCNNNHRHHKSVRFAVDTQGRVLCIIHKIPRKTPSGGEYDTTTAAAVAHDRFKEGCYITSSTNKNKRRDVAPIYVHRRPSFT